MVGTYKNRIKLRSGTYFDFIDPKPDQFTLEDICGALAKICRFGGQISKFYSVAEHCFFCSLVGERDKLSDRARLALLLHDAAEAFCGDVVRPLKMLLPEYGPIESRVQWAIEQKFSIRFSHYQTIIKDIDNAMLFAERNALFAADDVEWYGEGGVRKLDIPFRFWSPVTAETNYARSLRKLGCE